MSEEEYAKEKRVLMAGLQVLVDEEREGRCGVMEEVANIKVEMGNEVCV